MRFLHFLDGEVMNIKQAKFILAYLRKRQNTLTNKQTNKTTKKQSNLNMNVYLPKVIIRRV